MVVFHGSSIMCIAFGGEIELMCSVSGVYEDPEWRVIRWTDNKRVQ